MADPKPPMRVLLADDDSSVRSFLEIVLRRQGCQVTLAEDGSVAIERLEKGEPFELILTDYAMPNATGLDVLRAARKRAPKATAVLMSASLVDKEMRDSVERLADEILVKPIPIETIARLVERVASSAARK